MSARLANSAGMLRWSTWYFDPVGSMPSAGEGALSPSRLTTQSLDFRAFEGSGGPAARRSHSLIGKLHKFTRIGQPFRVGLTDCFAVLHWAHDLHVMAAIGRREQKQ